MCSDKWLRSRYLGQLSKLFFLVSAFSNGGKAKQLLPFWWAYHLETKTFRVVFNMKNFGAPTLKPTMLLTNSSTLCNFQCGTGCKKVGSRARKPKVCRSLCRRYLDRQGRPRFVGTRKLKGSQFLGGPTDGQRMVFATPSL